jgi:hypothetical protein
MKLVTVATHSDVYFPFLLESCKRYGAELNVLGWNQKWKGYLWKFQLVKDFISGLEDDEVVCFVDAYDVILTRPLKELEQAFRSLSIINQVGLVVGCDHFVNPFYTLINKFVFGKCHNKPLNSGTYIGYVKNIKELINDVLPQSHKLLANDQVAFTHFCKSNPQKVFIDCDNIIFLTILNPLNSVVDKNMFINTKKEVIYKGARPFFVHGNGNTSLNELIKALNYSMTKEDETKIRKANIQFIKHKVIHYLPHFFYVFLVIFIICFIICYYLYTRKT